MPPARSYPTRRDLYHRFDPGNIDASGRNGLDRCCWRRRRHAECRGFGFRCHHHQCQRPGGNPPRGGHRQLGYAVGAPAVTVSAPVLGVGAASLSAFGTTSLTVTVNSGGTPVTTPQNVTFSSSCASSGKAVLSTAVATVNGVATGSYRDNGCAGTDSITATAAWRDIRRVQFGRSPTDGGLDPVRIGHTERHFIGRNRGRIDFTSDFQGSGFRRKPAQRKNRDVCIGHCPGPELR